MAKPMPTEPPEGLTIAVVMPTTCPAMSNAGPPELPGLIGASSWRKRSNGPPPRLRPSAETMPAVTDPPRPNGLPAASIQSPTRTLRESPQVMAGSGCGGSTFSTATSVSGSRPRMRAGTWVPSGSATTILSACAITWLLVTITPSGATMKPEPAAETCAAWLP